MKRFFLLFFICCNGFLFAQRVTPVTSVNQYDFCQKFEYNVQRNTKAGSWGGVWDADLAEQWASYFEYSAWTETSTNYANITYFKVQGGKKPNTQRDLGEKYDMHLAIPPATPEIFKKHFSEAYLADLNKCSPAAFLSSGTNSSSKKADAVNHLLNLRARWKKNSEACKQAASAIREYKLKRKRLIEDMRSYCSGVKKPIVPNPTNNNINRSTIKLTNSNSNSTTKKNQTSYSKAKSSVKRSRISKEIDGAALLRAKQYEEYQRRKRMMTLQGQWESLNAIDKRLTSFFENTFWKAHEEKWAKEARNNRNKLNREVSFYNRRYSNYISYWEEYQSKIANWLLEYSQYANDKIIQDIEKDIKLAQGNIKAAIESKRKLDKAISSARDMEDSFIGGAERIWQNLIQGINRDIIWAPFYAFNSIKETINNNPTEQQKAMVADFAKIVYDHKKRYRPNDLSSRIYYARIILNLFDDYPGINTLKYEVENYDKDVAEKNRLANIRKEFDEILKLAWRGKGDELKALVDEMIKKPASPELKTAFFGPRGNTTQLNELYKNGGYSEAMLKLYDWLGGNFSSYRGRGFLVENLMKAFLISDRKSEYYLKKEINFLINNYISVRYGRDQTTSYKSIQRDFYRSALQALAGTGSMEDAKSKAKYLRKASKKRAFKYSNWFTKAVLFINGQENYLLPQDKDKRDYQRYLGIWTQPIKNGGQLEVTFVVPNSPAAKNGIKKDDKIVMIGYRGVKGINLMGEVPKDFETYNNMYLTVLKPDGDLYGVNIPIKITKENIKNGFQGTSKRFGNEREVQYVDDNKQFLVYYDGPIKQSNQSKIGIPNYNVISTFAGFYDGYASALIKLTGNLAKGAFIFNQSKKVQGKPDLMFFINNKGEYQIVNNDEKYQTKWIASEAIKNDDYNELAVIYVLENARRKMQFFINGAIVYEISDYKNSIALLGTYADPNTIVDRKLMYAYRTDPENLRYLMVANPPAFFDNVLVDESFNQNNKYKRLELKKKLSFRGDWIYNYLELRDKKRKDGSKEYSGYLNGPFISSSNFEMSFEFQFGVNHVNQNFFVSFTNDNENFYWAYISPYNFGIMERDKKNQNINHLLKTIQLDKNKFHTFRALSKNGIIEYFINGESMGTIEKNHAVGWSISEEYSDGLRIRNLKIISGR